MADLGALCRRPPGGRPILLLVAVSSSKNAESLKCFGGPGEIRTHDLFHAMEARSQLRHRPSGVLIDTITQGPRER
jgi:hypothetical protein